MSRRVTRRALIGAAALGGLGLLAACGTPAGPSAAPAPAQPAQGPSTAGPSAAPAGKGGTFNYAEAGDFNDFNPWTYTAVNDELYNQVFSRLAWKDGAGKTVPDLATEWQMAPDNLSLKLKLRDNAKWHDGKPLTADDFVTMWGYLKDDALAKVGGVIKVKGLMSPIKDVLAPDKGTLELKFDAPVPYVFDLFDWFYAIRIEDKTDPGFLKKLPVGTGPFKITTWVPNQFAEFGRHADYYDKGLPKLDKIVFKRLTQAETLLPNLKSGTLDGILMTSLADVGPLQADKKYTVDVNENSGSIFNVQVNVQKPPLDKKAVRQALSFSLNRVEMAKSAFFGVSRPLASPFYSPASLAYREDLVMAHAFDLDRARKLLEAAGVKNLDLTIVVTPAWSQMKLFSLVWQQDLKKIGVNLKINDVENAKFYDINSAKDFQGNDLQAWLNARTTRDPAIFWSTQSNYRGDPSLSHGYANAELERLVKAGASEPDTEKRRKIYQQLNEMTLDECQIIQVATNPRVFAYASGVAGMRVDLNGNLVMDQATVTR